MVPLDEAPAAKSALGSLARRFSYHDRAEGLLGGAIDGLHVVTGFGPTNAPTAGTLSVMRGATELEQRLRVPVTAVVSELGAWNSRNVPWQLLVRVRDGMHRFLRELGFAGTIRSHLDPGNLVRAGRIARFLHSSDLHHHREQLVELYGDMGLLGSDVGVTVDTLYTVADILEPADAGAEAILVVAGVEEAYFTELARVVLARQLEAGEFTLGWDVDLGALYFRVLPGLAGFPKMSKSIPESAIDLGMSGDVLRARICSDHELEQPALLAAIELASGWEDREIDAARAAYRNRREDPGRWLEVREAFLTSFLSVARIWRKTCPI